MDPDVITEKAGLLADSLAFLANTIEAALFSVQGGNADPDTIYSTLKWKNTALRLLRLDIDRLKEAIVYPDSNASIQSFLNVGRDEMGLAKNLDAFRFDFAGQIFERRLNDDVDAVVQAASNLVSSIAALGHS